MKELMCEWQETMLELGLNIHISRCVNPASDFYVDIVHKERCENCARRRVSADIDALAASLKDDVYIKLDERPTEVIEHLLGIHCRECDHFNKRDGTCAEISCEYPIPIRDLMQNPDTHCARGLW